MSTVKTDAIVAVSNNGNLDLSGQGTGGVKVSDYLVLTKGADIASATALTLGKDGSAFDVTGTTAISSIGTQGIGSHVTLHFDGALTFTHHATDLILPGAANITTAAGDIAVMYEYASGDWRCVSYTKADGKPVVAAGGGLTFISSTNISDDATVAFESLSATYESFFFVYDGLVPATDNTLLIAEVGTGSTTYQTSSYSYNIRIVSTDHLTAANDTSQSASFMQINSTFAPGTYGMGTASGEQASGTVYLNSPHKSLYTTVMCHGTMMSGDGADTSESHGIAGWESTTAVTAIRFKSESGNLTSGRITLFGIKHS
ncbi:hypothetical protein [uncultured Mediterranean phage]|nr:hypothetical protein [uncultured Mediterranean phage]